MWANLVSALSQHAGEERLLTRDRTPYEGAVLTANHLSGPSPNVPKLGVGNLSRGLVGTLPSADQKRPWIYPLLTWSSRDAGPRAPWTWQHTLTSG